MMNAAEIETMLKEFKTYILMVVEFKTYFELNAYDIDRIWINDMIHDIIVRKSKAYI